MIAKLWLKGYRNLEETVLSFEKGRSLCIWGKNNQGKTNFLESFYVMANGKSPLGVPVGHTVGFDSQWGLMGCDLDNNGDTRRLYVKVFGDGQRQIVLNDRPLRSFLSLSSFLNVSFVSSDIIRSIRESPEGRRRELDGFCKRYFKGYSGLLSKYDRLLRQRNRALKDHLSASDILPWTQQIVSVAQQLVTFRKEALSKLLPDLKKLCQRVFVLDMSSLVLSYSVSGDWNGDLNEYSDFLTDRLTKNLEKEYRVGYTLYGPHRDDWIALLNGRDFFVFCSKGMNRILSILLMQSMLNLLSQTQHALSILLLDDAFAEVDTDHKQQLFSVLIEKSWVVYTSVMPDDYRLLDKVSVYRMENGRLIFEKNHGYSG